MDAGDRNGLPGFGELSQHDRRDMAAASDSPTLLAALIDDADAVTARNALTNPFLSHRTMKQIALGVSSDWRRRALWENPAIPAELFEILDIFPDAFAGGSILALPLRHPNCPSTILERHAVSPHSAIRSAVAANINLPETVADQLVTDKSPSVLSSLALNPSATPPTLDRLMHLPIDAVKTSLLQRQDEFARQLDTLLFQHESPRIRTAVAKFTQRPDILAQLAFDEERSVRQAVYNNIATPDAGRVTAALLGCTE